MNIAIDARFYGTEHTGLGRYTTNVLKHLPRHLKDHTLYVLLRKKYHNTLALPTNCVKVLADFPHYSLAEQIRLPRLLSTSKCQLLYALHFNVPLRLPVPFVVTIHDLIKSHFTTTDTTTRSPWFFRLKRTGYDISIRHAVHDSVHIIVPSNTVRNDILALFDSDPSKITAIPEAPDDIFRKQVRNSHGPSSLPDKYLLYVGNAYQHKNLTLLLSAVEKIKNHDLVIVASKSPFLEKILEGRDLSRIHVLSHVTDNELVGVYARARALVTPSLMEGYGLPGIEALILGIPVIASNIPVYREVYKDHAIYFDPHSVSDLIKGINSIKSKKPTYSYDRSWDDVARDIAEVIRESCANL